MKREAKARLGTLVSLLLIAGIAAGSVPTQAFADPEPGTVIASFQSPGSRPEGLTWDGGYLWNADWSEQTIYKLDPSTGAEMASFQSPGPVPTGLAWDGDYLWNADDETNTIYKLDASTGAEMASFQSPGPNPDGLAWDGDYLWNADPITDTIYKLDPSTGAEMASFQSPGPHPYGVAWDGEYLWNADSDTDTIYKLDPLNGSLITSFASPGSIPTGLAWDGGYLWNADQYTGKIYKIYVGPPIEPPEFVLYLPMDEGSGSTIYDQSGNGNNGTIYGASWATGVSGSTLEFDGVDDYAEVHENTNLDGFDDFSVSIWIKPTTDLNSSTGRQDFYYKGPPVQWVTSYALNYDDVDGQLQFNLHSQSDWFSYASVRYETEFNAGQWYHIAVTYDGLSEVIMYVNGRPQGVDVGGDHGTISGLVVDNSYDLRLGARTDNQYYFNGAIDELRIYDRKLSDEEVLALHEEFAPSENQPPIASFTYSPETSVTGDEIDFDASSSTDPDGKIELYEWDWDNDGSYDESARKPTATHSWNAEGTYEVGLRVTDNDGARDDTSEEIIIVSSLSILGRYAPVLYFHPEEQFYPWGIESMLQKAELWLEIEIIKNAPTRTKVRDSVSPDDLHNFQSDPKAKDPYHYYLNLKGYTPYVNIPTKEEWEGYSFKVYGRYYQPDDNSDKIVLQYWFFYPFNDWDNGTPIDWNEHEGDWEMIQIILDRATKEPITDDYALHASQHLSGSSYEWSEIDPFEDTDHPKIFVAKGSHGCWHAKGDFEVLEKISGIKGIGKLFGPYNPKDLTSENGRVLHPEDIAPSDQVAYELSPIGYEPSWLMWNGWWGDREPQFFPIGTSGSKGPPSPGMQDKWVDPIKWSKKLKSWTKPGQAIQSTTERISTRLKSSLSQNYPNPCNPETTVEYSLAESCHVTLKIYNMAGKLIKTLIDEYQQAGSHKITWHGDNDAGQEVASGVYFYRIKAGDFVSTKKMVVLK